MKSFLEVGIHHEKICDLSRRRKREVLGKENRLYCIKQKLYWTKLNRPGRLYSRLLQ